MQNLIPLAAEEGGHAPENPLGFVPVEFALSLVVFGLLLFLIWKFVAPRFEQTFAERTAAIEGGLRADDHILHGSPSSVRACGGRQRTNASAMPMIASASASAKPRIAIDWRRPCASG